MKNFKSGSPSQAAVQLYLLTCILRRGQFLQSFFWYSIVIASRGEFHTIHEEGITT